MPYPNKVTFSNPYRDHVLLKYLFTVIKRGFFSKEETNNIVFPFVYTKVNDFIWKGEANFSSLSLQLDSKYSRGVFDFFRDKREFQVSLEPPTSFLDEGTIGRHFPSLVASLPKDELTGLDKIKEISIMEKM